MLLEHERLRSLIQFAQSAGAMRATPVSRIESHKDFAAYEHTLQGVKGVHFNTGDEDSGEIWLTVDRLYETKCSRPTNPLLKVWLESLDNPTKAPTLKESVDAIDLKEAGLLENSVSGTVFLNAFDRKEEVASLLKAFTKTVWTGWAEEEKQLRRTIELYGKLFTLKQQLEGAIVDGSIEIVWGVGITLWNKNGTQICYPLISHLIDIAVNEKTMAIEISPRNVEPRLELDIYAESDNPNIGKLETAWQEFNKGQTQSFSPFDSGCFDGILRYAATTLDAKGKYWPDFIQADDRSIPPLTDELKITDTWAVFARPRNRSLFVQDLERFKEKIELELTTVAGAAMKIFTDPLQENQQGMLPSYRGMSTIHGETRTSGSDVKELYFSLPYNDEQVRIVQLLENNDGVVVQGPPGTGKTHTIANIICHYFALGKRILVTSMKEPALKEVRDKLPAEVRPLAISLLTSEKGGTKQFEDAVYQISSEIQRIDMHWYRREIEALEKKRIDGLHAKLSSIDTEIEVWAKKNLMPIVIADREILPEAAAKMLVENAHIFTLNANVFHPYQHTKSPSRQTANCQTPSSPSFHDHDSQQTLCPSCFQNTAHAKSQSNYSASKRTVARPLNNSPAELVNFALITYINPKPMNRNYPTQGSSAVPQRQFPTTLLEQKPEPPAAKNCCKFSKNANIYPKKCCTLQQKGPKMLTFSGKIRGCSILSGTPKRAESRHHSQIQPYSGRYIGMHPLDRCQHFTAFFLLIFAQNTPQ